MGVARLLDKPPENTWQSRGISDILNNKNSIHGDRFLCINWVMVKIDEDRYRDVKQL